MIGIDFNLPLNFGQYALIDSLKGLANEYRTDRFLATDRFSSKEAFRQMRATISRQPSNEKFLLFRSISLHGFRPDNISPVTSGHRNMFAGNAAETLPLWYSRQCFPNHSGEGKRKARLEKICGLCTNSDKQSPNALCQRRFWHPIG